MFYLFLKFLSVPWKKSSGNKVILLHTKEIALLSLSNIVYFWWMVISQTCDVFSNSMISEPFINYVIVKVNSTFLCYF